MIKTCAGLTVFLMLTTTAQASFAPITSPIPRFRGGGQIVAYIAPKYIAPNALKISPIARLRSSKNAAFHTQTRQEITTLVQIAETERQADGFRRAKVTPMTTSRVTIGITAISRSIVPRLRPNNLTRNAAQRRVVAAAPTIQTPKRRRASRRGSVCGVRSIRGVNAPRISGRGSCGIANPVKVTEVAGIPLTRELVVNCTTAKRLDRWVARSVKPTIGRKGGGLASIQIIGGYACRSRNSKRGAKLSEHAKGNAVDIAGFKLKNGTIYSVKRDWRRGRGKSSLRRIHKSACGPFGTVLGPNADRHHQDHFHLDIARHRSGSYCR